MYTIVLNSNRKWNHSKQNISNTVKWICKINWVVCKSLHSNQWRNNYLLWDLKILSIQLPWIHLNDVKQDFYSSFLLSWFDKNFLMQARLHRQNRFINIILLYKFVKFDVNKRFWHYHFLTFLLPGIIKFGK